MKPSLLLLATLALTPVFSIAEEFFFRDGDKVVMIGDSITAQHLYSNYVEAWTLSRFPGRKIQFYNVGIGGDRSTGGNSRFKRDVLSLAPTAVTVDFGMNDGGYRPFDENGFKTFMGGLQGMADQAKPSGLRFAWCTPSPVEKAEEGSVLLGYNETLEKYSEGVKQIAAKNGHALFVDQLHPFMAVIDKARASNPKIRIGGGDAVHPGPAGQTVMAAAILRGMSFPTSVAGVEIDAGAAKLNQATQCTIDGLKIASDKVSFTQLDAALPFFPADAKSILQWSPILTDLNDYRLKVNGLKAGRYEIRHNGQKVAERSAEELATGTNLAAEVLASGPVAAQVNTLWSAIRAKNDYFRNRIFNGITLAQIGIPDWLGVKVDNIEAKRQAAYQERLAKMPELFEAIRQALVIKPHQVEIVPLTK